MGDLLLEICNDKNLKHMTLTLGCDDVKKQERPLGSLIKALRALKRQRENLLSEAGNIKTFDA